MVVLLCLMTGVDDDCSCNQACMQCSGMVCGECGASPLDRIIGLMCIVRIPIPTHNLQYRETVSYCCCASHVSVCSYMLYRRGMLRRVCAACVRDTTHSVCYPLR